MTFSLSNGSLTATQLSLSTNAVNDLSVITFQLTTSSSIAAGDCVKLTVSNPYSSTPQYYTPFSSASCSSTTGHSISCSLLSSTIVQMGFTSSSSVLDIKGTLSSLRNPFSKAILTFNVAYYSGCTTLNGQNTITFNQFKTGTISTASLATNSNTIAQLNCVLTLSFQIATLLKPTGKMELEVPKWFEPSSADQVIYYLLDFDTGSTVSSQSSSLTVTNGFLDGSFYKFDFSTSGSDITAGTTLTLQFTNFRNPTKNQQTTGFKLTTMDTSQRAIDITTSLALAAVTSPATVTATASNAVQIFNGANQDYTVAQKARTIRFAFTVNLPLELNCFVKISFPSQIKVDIDSTLTSYEATDGFMKTSTGTGILTGSSVSKSAYSTTSGSNTLTFPSCTETDQLGQPTQPSSIKISSIVSPTEVQSGTFGSFTITISKDLASTNVIAIGTFTPSITMVTGSISSMSFTPLTSTIVQEVSSYKISFTLSGNLFSTSIIEIDLPSGIDLTGVSTLSIVSAINILSSSSIALSGTKITLSNCFSDSSTFGFDSDISGSSITLTIQSAKNPYSVTAAGSWSIRTKNLVSGTLYLVDQSTSSTSFTPTVGSLAPGSPALTPSSFVTYQSSVSYTFLIEADQYVKDTGKVLIVVPSQIGIGSVSCQQGTSSTSCSSSGTTITVNLKNEVLAGATLQIIVGGLRNPRSTKETDDFTIKIVDSSNNLIMTGSGWPIKMTTAGTISSITVTPSSLVNGASSSYAFKFQSSIPFQTGDLLQITFPPETVLTSTSVNKCTNTQLNNQAMTCLVSGQTLTLTVNQASVTTLQFAVAAVINPPNTRDTSAFSSIRSYLVDSSVQYEIQQFTASTVKTKTTTAGTLTVYNLTQDSTKLAETTRYTITFTPVNKISATGSFKITWPKQVTIAADVSYIVTTTKAFDTGCEIKVNTREILCKAMFTAGYTSQISIELEPVINPKDARDINGFLINTYDDADQKFFIDQLGDNLLKPSFACDFPCATCSVSNRTDCLSCWSDIGYPKLQKYSGFGTCKPTCDTGFTTNGDKTNNICTNCDASCSKCMDQGSTGDMFKCITCSTGYNFRYQPTMQCFQKCEGAFYQVNSTTCMPCQSPCETCNGQGSICTSCDVLSGKPFLYENSCTTFCPSGYATVGLECKKCQAPCSTCGTSPTQCLTCDKLSASKYFYNLQCVEKCPEGTTANEELGLCGGCGKLGCQICDTSNQDLCLKCADGLYLFDNECSASCPDGYKPNFMETECVTLLDLPLIYFPHLIASLIMFLVVVGGYVRDKKSRIITNTIVFVGFIEFISFLVQTLLCFVYANYKFAALSFVGFFSYILINIAYMVYFLLRIYKKDPEFVEWRYQNKKTALSIMILGGLFSFKINKLFYSGLYGYDIFKARIRNKGSFQKSMLIFTIIHIVLSNGLVLIFDAAGFSEFQWGNQLYINIIETLMISIILIVLEIVEFFFMKQYLKDSLDYYQVNHDSVMNASDMPSDPSLDKKLREETLKTIMGKVKGNQDLFLNNKLDDLFSKFGSRRCNSMIAFDNEKEEDPRKTRSEPISPNNQDFKFDKDAMHRDNVYADSQPANPVGKYGKNFIDADTQVRDSDYDKILGRKGNDFVNFDPTDTSTSSRNKKNRKRGRKNQYYTQIDAEDDEEVENNKDGPEGDEEDLGVIKEEDDEHENLQLQQQMLKQQQEEQERVRIQEEKLKKDKEEQLRIESEKLKQQQIEAQKAEEERLVKEQEEADRKNKEALAKLEEERLKQQQELFEAEEAVGESALLQANSDIVSDVGLNKPVLIEDSLNEFNQLLNQDVQVPPDSAKRNFNENDILGDFDRDEKGNVIVLQDENGLYVDKQGRRVNERGYLIEKETGDIIENTNNRKMFDHNDIDERGEIPAPFCVEKYNFNPFSIRGHFDFDKSGRPIISVNKTKELVDKKGRRVNKGGWLIDHFGNIIDNQKKKKFDKKQLVSDGQDLPKFFNYNGRRFDMMDICGNFDMDSSGNIILRKNKKGIDIDNQGRLVNEKGYLVDAEGNIVNKEGKKIFEKKHLKNGEISKILPFTKFKLKNITGNFEMDPLGNPILDKNSKGQLIDRDGKLVNKRGYLINENGDVIDKNGKKMFDKEILDDEGEIPKVFRTGLLKSDTASSLSRLMSEIEKNQPFEEANDALVQQEMQRFQRNQQNNTTQQLQRRDSNGTSLDSMMEDTPSNYNVANQRFDPNMLQKNKSQMQTTYNKSNLRHASRIDEEDSEFDEFDANGMKKKRLRKKKKDQAYKDPSDKDLRLAKAYGGIAKPQVKKLMPKATNSNRIHTPISTNHNPRQLQKLAGSISGFQNNQLSNASRDRLEEIKRDQFTKDPAHQTYQSFLNDNEPSIQAVPEHHIREQRLKQKKMNELKQKNKQVIRKKKANNGGFGGDPDFEKMFGKDIDEFLEDSDWDIESFGKMSNFSKGTARSAFGDGRIRGLESIYLQRIETSLKKGGKQGLKNKKSKAAFRVMQDRFIDDPDFLNEMSRNEGSSGISPGQSRNKHLRKIDSANTTALVNNRSDANIFQKGRGPNLNQTQL